MKTKLTLIFCYAGFIKIHAQTKPPCTIVMGGAKFTNMEHMIVYRGYDVFVINYNDAKSKFEVTMQYYDNTGKEIGRVFKGDAVAGYSSNIDIKNTAETFTVVQKQNNHILCFIKKQFNPQRNRCELLLSLDSWLPGGMYLQCSPEGTHSPQLQNYLIGGVEFSNGGTAISIE